MTHHDPVQEKFVRDKQFSAMEIAFGDMKLVTNQKFIPKPPPPPEPRIILEPGLFHNFRIFIKRLIKRYARN